MIAAPGPSFCFIAGTRPEAVKLAPVVHALRGAGRPTLLLATGQHRELLHEALAGFGLVADRDLAIMKRNQGPADVVGTLVPALVREILAARPGVVIVQGDTASAFAGAQAAAYARLPLAHVEAGLRSGSTEPFPEEMHRKAIAQLADVHFAPTVAAAMALLREGVPDNAIRITGNTGIDALRWMEARLARDQALRQRLVRRFAALPRGRPLVIATVHRRENHRRLPDIVAALATVARDAEIVIPVHPHPVVGAALAALDGVSGVQLLPPLDYPAFVWLLRQAALVLTDSGGIQEEAPALGVPVLVLRDSTERPEGIADGNARLVGGDRDVIVAACRELLADAAARRRMAEPTSAYGMGDAAPRIASELMLRFGGGGAEAFEQRDEVREAGGDRPRVVDDDRRPRGEA